MKTVTKVISVAALTGLVASPAFAGGDREQGILTGIGAAQILRHVVDEPKPAPIHPG